MMNFCRSLRKAFFNHRLTTRLPCFLVAFCCLPSLTFAGSVLFEDTTDAAGVNYLHWDGVVPPLTAPDRELLYMCGGAAAGDVDRDGWVDLYVTRVNMPNLLFRNLGNGTFEEVGVAAGVDLTALSAGCALGDIDNDGDLDLYVLVFDPLDRNYLYINNGSGQFSEEAIPRGVHLQALNPGTESRRYTSSAFGDYDLDGDLDLMVTEWIGIPTSKNLLFRNDGAGNFTEVSIAAGVSIPGSDGFAPSFSDINNDGWPELLVAADFGTSCMLENLCNGQFTNVTVSAGVGTDENGMGSAVGDYDGDGDLDWFVTSIFDPDETCEMSQCGWGYSGNRLYRNDGNVQFSDQTDAAGVRDGAWGWGASFFDFDNDGDQDLAMTNGVDFPSSPIDAAFNHDAVRLWQNDGTGNMTEVGFDLRFIDTGSGKGLLVFDYDGDGDQDVFIVNNAAEPVLYRNNGGNANDWLKIMLVGHRTNGFGIGARIFLQVTSNGPTQMHEVNLNSNFMSQNDFVAHFGLGASSVTSIHSVRIHWPVSGIQQELNNVAPNQFITIEEPGRKGDVNLDTLVDTGDIVAMVEALLAESAPSPAAIWAADMNGDEFLNGEDIPLFTEAVLSP
ncbi:MAG: FG-GAP-like repeat-containing protein [Phycisphaerales bacterium]|nr:FG-GAP-like repeat-containing protein [Phycisphaerales bacterium]